MKFNIMSDLHLEFGELKDMPGGDTLLLAGDIGLAKDNTTYLTWLENTCKKYNLVIMIMGNHEHYHGDFNTSVKLLARDTKHISNLEILDNDVVEIGKEVAVIGATLWSDIDPEHSDYINHSMNDFRIVKNFNTTRAVEEFNKSKDYIREKLNEYKDKEKVIVMTHHAPSLQVPEIYRGSALNSAYGSDLEALIEAHKPSLWIHGHTHVSRKYIIGDTPVVCNPRGYAGHELNPEFDINLVWEV